MPVKAFNAYLEKRSGLSSPSLLALEFARVDNTHPARTTTVEQASPEGGGPTAVTVTLDGLADDSVRAVRYVLHFDPAGVGWRLRSATWAQRCQAGRGHEDFGASGCV
jgi:hypothetical protein